MEPETNKANTSIPTTSAAGGRGRTERRRPRQRTRNATCGGSARRKPPPLRHDEGPRPCPPCRRGGPRARPPPVGSSPSNSKSLPPADVDQVDAVFVAASLEDDRVGNAPFELEDRLLGRIEGLRVGDEQVRRDLL